MAKSIIIGGILALAVAWLICGKDVKLCIDIIHETLQHTEMIDPKYFDMLKNQSSFEKQVTEFLNETIDNLIASAICKLADQPIPKELGFEDAHLGENKLSKRKLIIGDLPEKRNIHVEFSKDFKKGYVAKRGYTGYEEVILTEDASKAAETLFTTIRDRMFDMSLSALPNDPKLAALSEFLSETRYGDNEYLCNEYLNIYRKIVTDMTNEIDVEEVREVVKSSLLGLEITDIRQFLKDNGIDPDTVGVHIVDL